MKAKKEYTIRHYRDRQGKDLYPIYYKRDDLPWTRLATAHHKEVAEQVVERLKAEDEIQFSRREQSRLTCPGQPLSERRGRFLRGVNLLVPVSDRLR